MKIAILSRSLELYSTQRLYYEGTKKNHSMIVVDHTLSNILLNHQNSELIHNQKKIQHVHAVIPRIGASVTNKGMSIINHFHNQGIYSTLQPKGLFYSRNKFYSLQKLHQAGIPYPPSALVHDLEGLPYIYDQLGFPLIIKLLSGTHGSGVLLIHEPSSATSIIQAFLARKEPILLQKFIHQSQGQDIRIFVIGKQVVGSMSRIAQQGEFRSNIHLGATSKKFNPSPQLQKLAIKATKALGLQIAGVDILLPPSGPLVIEVNPSPGLEGIESITKTNIAEKIILHIENYIKGEIKKT